MNKPLRKRKMEKNFQGSRVKMVKSDRWAAVGWTGIVMREDSESVIVRWDNGKRYSHMKYNLKMIPITAFDDPNTAFAIYIYIKGDNYD